MSIWSNQFCLDHLIVICKILIFVHLNQDPHNGLQVEALRHPNQRPSYLVHLAPQYPSASHVRIWIMGGQGEVLVVVGVGIIGEGGERGSKEGHRMREEDGEGTKPRRQKSIRVWLRGQRRECIEWNTNTHHDLRHSLTTNTFIQKIVLFDQLNNWYAQRSTLPKQCKPN